MSHSQHSRNGAVVGRPLIPLFLSLAAGVVAGLYLPGFGLFALAGSAIAVAIVLRARFRETAARFSPVWFFIILGYLSIQPWSVPQFPGNHIIHFTDGRKWRIVGIIDGPIAVFPGRSRFNLRVERLIAKDGTVPASGHIRVTVIPSLGGLERGDRLSVEGRPRRIRNYHNFGGFDYERYMALNRIWVTVFSPANRVDILDHAHQGGITLRFERFRSRVSQLIDASAGENQRGILKALILGDGQQLPDHVRNSFHRAGIGHLLAISGLHIGIVAAAAFKLFNWFFSRFAHFPWRGSRRKLAALCSFIPVLIYAILSGMSTSTQRALIMVGFFLLAFIIERDRDNMNTLTAAAMAILIFHPPALFTISFQLSFMAVFWIITGLEFFRPREPEDFFDIRFLRQRLVAFMMVSVLATLGTMPLLMHYFNQISLVGTLTNCIFVPIIGFLVIPLGLSAAFLLPVSETAAGWCLHAAAGIMAPVQSAAEWIAALPFSAAKTVTPSVFEICCYYLLALLLTEFCRARFPSGRPIGGTHPRSRMLEPDRTPPPDSPRRSLYHRYRLLFRTAVALVLLALTADVIYWSYQRFWRQDLRVTILDVGQGCSALLEFPGGACMLIDGGGFSDNSIFDVGARIVAPVLWRKKILSLDHVVLSHPNSDHLNGLIYIVENFKVGQIWTNGQPHQTHGYLRFTESIRNRNIPVPHFQSLSRSHPIQGVLLEILYPPDNFMALSRTDRWRNENNNSMVLKVSQGDVSMLFTGDIMKEAENELVAIAGDRLRSTILVVPHHGSNSSSSNDFIDSVSPRLGVVSTGWKNRFHLPHPSTLERYRRRGMA